MNEKIINALKKVLASLSGMSFEVTPLESVLVSSEARMICGHELDVLISFCRRRHLHYYVRSIDYKSEFVIYKQ